MLNFYKSNHYNPAKLRDTQRPLPYCDLDSSVSQPLCPHCKQTITIHQFTTHDGLSITTYHCGQDGDVVPLPRLSS